VTSSTLGTLEVPFAMARSDASRVALLDAAERLFAENGISGVSDRRIADAAGQKNHSAVAYYFGDRNGLLTALVRRHAAALDHERLRLSDASATLLDDVRAVVLPTTSVLAALPAPSWRARFIARALHHQDTVALVEEDLDLTPTTREIARSVVQRLAHLDRAVVTSRVRLLFRVVGVSCADVEREAAETGHAPNWEAVGIFLADALAGMLAAPSTQSSLSRTIPTA
jgi:AcrR family transcriptional regulator